jgi:PAS domain S-box-containing protein
MHYTWREARVTLLPSWLNLDSCSIIRLATLILSLTIAVYLLLRKNKTPATRFLGLVFCGAAIFHLTSLLEFAGYHYWQPRNIKNLAVPLLQHISPSLALVSFTAFTYAFPRPVPAQKREYRLTMAVVIFIDSAMLVLTVFTLVFLERQLSYFRFTMTYYTLLYATIGGQVVLIVFLLLRKAVLLSTGKGRTWLARLLAPHGRDARTARSLAVIMLLLVAAIASYVFLTYGFLSLPVATYCIWLAFLLFYFSFVVTYLNHTTESSTFQVKLVGLTLIPVLGILGLVALFVGKSTESDYSPLAELPLRRTLLFSPNRFSGYDIQVAPLRFDPELGEKLDVSYGGWNSLEMGFAFPFFGRRYTRIHVLHSPMIYLGEKIEENGWGGYRPNPAIAPMLLNLDPTAVGGIFLKAEPRTWTVTWYRLPELGFDNSNTVQLVLKADGSFAMSFVELNPEGRYGSVLMYNFTTATTTGRHPGSRGSAVAFGPRLTGIHPGGTGLPLRALRFVHDLPYSSRGPEVLFQSYEEAYLGYLHRRISVLAVLMIAASLFIVFFMPILFRTNLIKPLRALQEGMQKAESGDLEVKVSPQYHDEIGFLAHSFNRMLEAIRRAEGGFWMLAKNAQDGILILRKGLPVFANRRACEITGYDAPELMRIELHTLIAPGVIPPDSDMERQPFETLLCSKAGAGVPVELTSSQTVWHGQPAQVVIIRDITERRKREEKTRQRQQRLTQLDKLTTLGVMLAGMAHEIRNPNQTILGNVALLMRASPAILSILDEYFRADSGLLIAGLEEAEFRDSFPRLLSGIETCSRRIEEIIQNLRSFSREDPFPVMGSLDVNEAIRAAADLASSHIRLATERFSLELEPNLPKVRGNSRRLEQVIVNLLLNACQALPERSSPISLRSSSSEDRRQVRIEVRDQGIGIPSEDLARLAQPFFSTKRAAGGSGLGLYVSQAIVAEHGGTLGFASRPGEGTVATISLPAEVQR